ncbi:MAG TPA: DUF5682 family protein [Micromonosporaceae bacterium]|nr:DUF5682 family protein [Micromonosporaceae bacterium]
MTEAHLLGIRHHGPGSARAVRRTIEKLGPDLILVEGPPEADGLLSLVGDSGMRPPVALLGYVADDPSRCAFWPFATFSPEWQAIQYGLANGIPVRFCDLPAAHSLAAPAEPETPAADQVRQDPLSALANAAGYDDPERWWDDVIEHRLDDATPFTVIAEAMTEVRSATQLPGSHDGDASREAYMRGTLRAARRAGHRKVAVVCGAWHVPALADPLPPASHDAKLLRGLPKVKVTMTWVPWTHGRLAADTGYRAGVTSPGWYHHLFTAERQVLESWFVTVARLLRQEGQPVSSAHLIEAVRLAQTLATLRGRPLAGLAEVTEATHAVICDGDDVRLALVHRKVVIGERLGTVPAGTPAIPLQRDLDSLQRRLRLKPDPTERALDLDLRSATDAERSRLLHRLRVLGVAWGEPTSAEARNKGTFRESWRLSWKPEYPVSLIEASRYGTTVARAATARVREAADTTRTLAHVTGLVEQSLLADLPEALPSVLTALGTRAALDTDVNHLADALPPLARTLRYGDVRSTDTGAIRTVTADLVVRICVGLPVAVSGLADDAARDLIRRIDAVHGAIGLLDDDELRDRWLNTLDMVAPRTDLAGPLAGRLTRLLYDAERLAGEETARRLGLVLTTGVSPDHAAGWIEGFFSGGGLLLLHDEDLLRVIDQWLSAIPTDHFVEVLPLLRRTFGTFSAPERRSIGERVAQGLATASRAASKVDNLDHERAAPVVATITRLLGLEMASS